MSTLTKAQLSEVLALIEAEVARCGSEASAGKTLGISQQLVNKARSRGEIGVVAVRKIATNIGRAVAGIAPESNGDAVSPPVSAALPEWGALAAASPDFAVVAADARAAGYSERELDAAAVRLRGRMPTPEEAFDAIRAARAGISRFLEADAPGALTQALAQGKPAKAGRSGKRKPT